MTDVTATVDVAVVGLGVMGAMSLWRCAVAGLSATGIEQFEPGHSRGSSHGHSRLFRVTCLEGAVYTRLAARALPLWRELEAASGRSLLTRTGGLMIGPPESNVVRASLDAARESGVEGQLLSTDEVRARYPQFRVDDGEVAVLDERAGMIDAEGSVLAATATAQALGARIVTGSPVLGVEELGGSVEVRIGDEVIRARHVIVAAGPWTGRVLGARDVRLAVRREVMAWFRPRPGAEQAFEPERFPIFVRALPDGPGAWGCGLQTAYGIKAVRERSGEDAWDPAEIPMKLQTDDGARSAQFVRDYLPGLDPEPSLRQTCLTTHTPDHGFVIGAPQGRANTTVLAGFSGHGFKHAPAVGQIAAELATNTTTPFDLTAFDPGRIGL